MRIYGVSGARPDRAVIDAGPGLDPEQGRLRSPMVNRILDERDGFFLAAAQNQKSLWLTSAIDSPIEILFFWAFLRRAVGYWGCLLFPDEYLGVRLEIAPPKLILDDPTMCRSLGNVAELHRVYVCSQVPVAGTGYKLDFVIKCVFAEGVAGYEKSSLIAVECDGHDFHERTKQQAAHDKRRDRVMTAGGLRVLRFTGSEIFKDAGACATQVMQCLGARYIGLGENDGEQDNYIEKFGSRK